MARLSVLTGACISALAFFNPGLIEEHAQGTDRLGRFATGPFRESSTEVEPRDKILVGRVWRAELRATR
jgi:hypothetical protein